MTDEKSDKNLELKISKEKIMKWLPSVISMAAIFTQSYQTVSHAERPGLLYRIQKQCEGLSLAGWKQTIMVALG